MDDGRVVEVGPGDLFEIGPGHDSVVVGDERYVSIHFLGAEHYSGVVIIYLLRHGDAGDPRPQNDDARELSDKGRRRLHNAAGLWRRLRVAPDVVISSPLPRAHQTAELLVEGLGLPLADRGRRPAPSRRQLDGPGGRHGGPRPGGTGRPGRATIPTCRTRSPT